MAAPGARSRRLNRLSKLALLACAGVALAMVAASSPSPSLSSLLAAPPPGYVEDTESAGTPVGDFDELAYLDYLGPDNQDATSAALKRDGFVHGFGKSWTHQVSGAGFAEVVVAFQGAAGARRWLDSTAAAARKDPLYAGDVKADGIGPYVGVRYADPNSSAHADVISFVKGNDFFLVGFVSKADMADAASAQARLQYDFAAAESIPSADWPENARRLPSFGLATTAAVFALLLSAMVVVAGLWLAARRRRRLVPPGPYLSPDGFYWWDGEAWRLRDPPPP